MGKRISAKEYAKRIPLLICAICSVFCFLPIMLNLSFEIGTFPSLSNAPLVKAVSSITFRDTLYFSLGIPPTILVALLPDMYTNRMYRPAFRTIGLLVSVHFIFGVVLVFHILPGKHFEILPCIFNFAIVLYSIVLVDHMQIFGEEVWELKKSFGVMLLFTCTGIIDSLSAFQNLFLSAALALKVITFAILCVLCVNWMNFIKINCGGFFKQKPDLLCCSLYLASLLLLEIGLWLAYFCFAGIAWISYTESYCVCFVVLLSVFVMLVTQFNGTIERWDLAFTEQANDTKRMFIRYISHELRNPMSAVTVGLGMIVDEVQKVSVNSDLITDIARDVKVQCDAALVVLDDLLLMDKMEGDIIRLSTQKCAVKELVEIAMRPFYLHVSDETNPNTKLSFLHLTL